MDEAGPSGIDLYTADSLGGSESETESVEALFQTSITSEPLPSPVGLILLP